MNNFSRRNFVRVTAAGALAAGMTGIRCSGDSRSRPNFIFFLTDDQRWDGMSCAGNQVLETPNMDRLAAEGLRFTEMFVTTALCGPSRASFLTGKYAHNTGVRVNGKSFSAEQITFMEELQQSGYETAFVGKPAITYLTGKLAEFGN